MKYKLVAIDMDGTLLSSDNEVSERTISAINKATEKGVNVVLATGRILKSAEQYADVIGLNNYILASNGSIIVDSEKNIIFNKAIKSDIVKRIMELGKKFNVYYHFYDQDTFYSNVYISEVANYYNSKSFKGQAISINIFKEDSEIYNNKNINVYKFLFIDNEKEKLINLRQELTLFSEINVSSSWDNNIEVMDKDVCKGKGVEFLCKELNILPEEVISIGDNENDLSMIEFAGLGVAMGNGSPLVKEKADIITSTNDDNGVAKVIEKYILETGDEI